MSIVDCFVAQRHCRTHFPSQSLAGFLLS